VSIIPNKQKTTEKPAGLFNAIKKNTAGQPLQRITIDFIGPLLQIDGTKKIHTNL